MNPRVREFRAGETDLLSVEPGLAGAAYIPLEELVARTYELPERSRTILVADTGPAAAEAVDWLRSYGRHAELGVYRGGGAINPRLWSPNRFLLAVLEEIPPSTALDLGCGVGREAVALAGCGWKVTGIDNLPDALERARLLETRYSWGAPITFLCEDAESIDRIGPFGLVTMFRFLHRALVRSISGLLDAGGSFVAETFTTLHRERHGRPGSDAHVLAPGELRDLVAPLEVARYDEGWQDGAHTARVWARKPA
jgi:SAM-dependent methyltransferase